MPPKNTPKLDPGAVYFHTPEGPQQLYPLDEATDIEAETEWPKEDPCIKPATGATLTAKLLIRPDVAKAFTALGEAGRQAAEALGRVCRAWVDFAGELCSLVEFEKQREAAVVDSASPRVRHLAKYGKKYRTRKKNINRAWREYQKEADK